MWLAPWLLRIGQRMRLRNARDDLQLSLASDALDFELVERLPELFERVSGTAAREVAPDERLLDVVLGDARVPLVAVAHELDTDALAAHDVTPLTASARLDAAASLRCRETTRSSPRSTT